MLISKRKKLVSNAHSTMTVIYNWIFKIYGLSVNCNCDLHRQDKQDALKHRNCKGRCRGPTVLASAWPTSNVFVSLMG